MSNEDSPLILISNIYEYNQINDFLQDPEVTEALNKMVKILAKPDIGGQAVTKAIVQCQGWANSFAIKAKYYMIIGKGDPDASQKKNIYMTLKESFSDLCQALKYISKAEH